VAAASHAALRPVARELAERAGAILPLVGGAELRRGDLLWRLCVEQTLTINTAAAGGNAELLAATGSRAHTLAPEGLSRA